MRTADICPTCATYYNALCVLYNGTALTTLNISPLDSLETALAQLETWASTVGVTNTISEWATVSGTAGAGTLLVRLGDAATTDIYIDTINDQISLNGANTISDGIITANAFKLNLAAGHIATQGEIAWNADEETIDVGLNGAILQAGQEIHYHVRNNTGVQINNGTPVMATGTIGNSGRITVAPMNNNGTIDNHYFMGIATEDIGIGDDGKITHFGKIRGIQTDGVNYGETWIDGDLLYLDPGTVGGLTKVVPTTGALIVPVAIVISAHADNGTLFVRVNIQDAPRLKAYTVATLPSSATEGDRAYVTDATAPTYLGTLTGGGAVKCPVFYNGTAWVSA